MNCLLYTISVLLNLKSEQEWSRLYRRIDRFNNISLRNQLSFDKKEAACNKGESFSRGV